MTYYNVGFIESSTIPYKSGPKKHFFKNFFRLLEYSHKCIYRNTVIKEVTTTNKEFYNSVESQQQKIQN